MKRRYSLASVLAILLVSSFALSVWATNAEVYFASDKNGQNRITKIQEGDEIWIAVFDPDEDIDCDVRDKIWTDVKVIDAKTGAHIVWKSYLDANGVDTDDDGAGDKLYGVDGYKPYKGHYPGNTVGYLGEDFLEETDSSTGLFVSKRPFQIGTRVNFGSDGRGQTHIVGPYAGGGPAGSITPTDFEWGNYLYADIPADANEFGDNRVWVDSLGGFIDATAIPTPPGNAYLPGNAGASDDDYVLGRFENMDTVVGLYVDQNDASDVAVTMGKIIDTHATISWGRDVYKDANEAATITVVDPDENINCNKVELVPIFIIVNPGSWNPLSATSATNFCMLKRYGGVIDTGDPATVGPGAMVWHNIYDSGLTTVDVNLGSNQPNIDGSYYIEYPTAGDGNVTSFDTASVSGVTRVMFYAQETGADTGIFQLNLNSILRDLGFKSLRVRDVLVAYYIDPNDQDDFRLGTAYIEERQHSITRFTDMHREDEDEFWIGRAGCRSYL